MNIGYEHVSLVPSFVVLSNIPHRHFETDMSSASGISSVLDSDSERTTSLHTFLWQEAGHMEDRSQGYARTCKRHDGRRMRMDDRVDLGVGFQDLTVDAPLRIAWPSCRVHRTCVLDVVFDEVVRRADGSRCNELAHNEDVRLARVADGKMSIRIPEVQNYYSIVEHV